MNRSEKWDIQEKQGPKIDDEFFENQGWISVFHFKSIVDKESKHESH